MATFVCVSEGALLEVRDEEAEPGSTNRYFLEAHNVLPLPRSASFRDERAMPQGSPVLGVRQWFSSLPQWITTDLEGCAQVFPGTTTFYRAVVLAQPRRNSATGEWGEYTLQFDDDDEMEVGQGRPVEFKHVVRAPPM